MIDGCDVISAGQADPERKLKCVLSGPFLFLILPFEDHDTKAISPRISFLWLLSCYCLVVRNETGEMRIPPTIVLLINMAFAMVRDESIPSHSVISSSPHIHLSMYFTRCEVICPPACTAVCLQCDVILPQLVLLCIICGCNGRL